MRYELPSAVLRVPTREMFFSTFCALLRSGIPSGLACGSRSVCFASRNPQTENGRGFDSRCHIKRGVVITQVSSPGLSLWWKRVIAMAVFPLDFAVLAMDEELRSLVSANLPPSIDGLLLCVKMTAGPA